MARIYGQETNNKVNLWERLIAENASTPMVYVFTSETCGFCNTAKPYVESLDKKYADFGVEVMYIDVDANSKLVSDAGVHGWPFFYFVKDGVVTGSDEGWSDDQKTELERKLNLLETYGTTAGLLPAGAPTPREDGACGDSAHQTAALAEGIQSMFADLENKIEAMNRSTQSHIEGVRSLLDARIDAYEKLLGGKQCTCGKH